MNTLENLKKYLDYEFSSDPYTGDDYKTFERLYQKYLTEICKKNSWLLADFNKNHYDFSAFVCNEYGYIYISICDVRYFKNWWYKNIMYRTAKNEKDYTGGRNQYTSLDDLETNLIKCFERL